MKEQLFECEDCGWQCWLSEAQLLLNPECDNCGGELFPVKDVIWESE